MRVGKNKLRHGFPERVNYVRNEPDLALGHVDGVPVAERRDLETLLSLLVSLVEALLHQAVDPLGVEGQRLGWVGEVATVDQVLEHLDSVVVRKRCIKGLKSTE